MKKLLLACIFAATLAVGLLASVPRDSVQPIQSFIGNNFCTAFSINEAKHLYGTAAHCVSDDAPVPRMFGYDIDVVKIDPAMDLAVIQARFGAPAYKLSDVEMNPQLCYHDPRQCEVTAFGFPLGSRDATINSGHYIARRIVGKKINSPVALKEYSLFVFSCAPGCSGGPIINSDGKLQSVIQISTKWDDGDGDVVILFGGATLEQVREFFGPYVG